MSNAMCLENGDIQHHCKSLLAALVNEDYQMIDRIKKAYEKRFWMEDFDLSNFREDYVDKDIKSSAFDYGPKPRPKGTKNDGKMVKICFVGSECEQIPFS